MAETETPCSKAGLVASAGRGPCDGKQHRCKAFQSRLEGMRLIPF